MRRGALQQSYGADENAAPSVPFLPGYTSRNASAPRPLSSTCRYVNGIAIVLDQENVLPPPQPSSSAGAERQASRPSTARSAADDYVHKGGTPAWLKFAGQSLTFGAYFVEAVHNDPVERSRVRRCFIRYHLEDGMLEVAEPVEPNSGLQAGRLLHRHRAVLADGTPVTWRHLAVGGELPLYGRAFRITSCDAATRAFYESNGLPVAPDQPAPEGAYDALARFRAYYRSAAAGRPGDGVLFATMGRRDAAAEQYLALSGKVLRFYCCWDNSAEQRDEAGFRVPLILHYHLEDDSLALHFAAGNDDLTEAYPTLLKRGKLPKASPGVGILPLTDFQRKQMASNGALSFYHWHDLSIGAVLSVYGRTVLLCDCDAFTRAWYQEKMGAPDEAFAPIKVNWSGVPPRPPLVVPADELGIGSEADSLRNVLNPLAPRPPPHAYDPSKNDVVLRFWARMVAAPGHPLLMDTDAERSFVLTYNTFDDTLTIYEPKKGQDQGGKFLDRAHVRKPPSANPVPAAAVVTASGAAAAVAAQYYGPSDLFVGAVLVVYSRAFELVSADESTLQHMERHKDEYPWADPVAVLAKIYDATVAAPEARAALLRQLVTVRSGGAVSASGLLSALSAAGIRASLHEALTVVRRLAAAEAPAPDSSNNNNNNNNGDVLVAPSLPEPVAPVSALLDLLGIPEDELPHPPAPPAAAARAQSRYAELLRERDLNREAAVKQAAAASTEAMKEMMRKAPFLTSYQSSYNAKPALEKVWAEATAQVSGGARAAVPQPPRRVNWFDHLAA